MALGHADEARLSWQSAMDADPPYGYYGIRASELLDGKEPFTEDGNYKLKIDLDNERVLAADWLKYAFSLPADINTDYSSALESDARYMRGMEYNRLGLFDKANNEFESLRLENTEDPPLNTFRLLKLFWITIITNPPSNAPARFASWLAMATHPWRAFCLPILPMWNTALITCPGLKPKLKIQALTVRFAECYSSGKPFWHPGYEYRRRAGGFDAAHARHC